MNTKKLIQDYQDELSLQKIEKENKYRAFVSSAKTILSENIKVWLGDIYNEFEMGDFSDHKHATGVISLHQEFVWSGIDGVIEVDFWSDETLKRNFDYPVMKFLFPNVHLWGQTLYTDDISIALPADTHQIGSALGLNYYKAIESVVSKTSFVQSLIQATQKKSERDEVIQKDTQRKNDRDIENFKSNIRTYNEPQKYHAQAVEKRPDMKDVWDEVLLETLAEREKIKAEQKAHAEEKQRLEDLETQEKDFLKEQVSKFFRPIVLYRVYYGAHVERNGDEDYEETQIYTETHITLHRTPDSDNYFHVIHNGKITKTELPHVFKIERVEVRTIEDMSPLRWNSAFQIERLYSAMYPSLSQEYYVIPDFVEGLEDNGEQPLATE